MASTIAVIAFSFFGLIGIAGSILNWQVPMEPSHNYRFVNGLGPRGVRIFYGVLGAFLFCVGMAFLVGAIRFGAGG
jgi:hypothetical protein